MTAAATATPVSWPPHVGGRTHQKVRRGSQPFEAGEAFFRPLRKSTVTNIMRAAERLAIRSMRTRGRGKVKRLHAGELTLPDLAILEALLFKYLNWKTGRCAPTYEDLQRLTGHARDTIARAIARLTKAGILERMRRFRVADGADGKGPQVHQAPNAYRFDLPTRLRALLGLGGEGTPIPDDAAGAARDARQSKIAYALQDLDLNGVSSLEGQLGRLARAVTQRESGD